MVLIYVYGSIGSSYGVLWILIAVLDITQTLRSQEYDLVLTPYIWPYKCETQSKATIIITQGRIQDF